MLFRKKITYDHDKRYKQNASVPGKKLFETKHANFLQIFTRCRNKRKIATNKTFDTFCRLFSK